MAGLDVILYAFLFLAVGALCRQLVLGRGISMPVHSLMILAGALMGVAAKIIPVEVDPMHLHHVIPDILFNIYMCILMFDCSFNTDTQNLRMIAYHMIAIAIPTMFMIYVMLSVVGFALFPYNLTLADYIALVSVLVAPGPSMMKVYLAPTSLHLDLKIILEAEAMFGNYIALMTLKSLSIQGGFHVAIIYVILDILISVMVGFVVGKIIIYWISKIFKDFVNQTTIILASSFAGYAISFLLGTRGFLCVVTIGLVLSHRRSCMSTHFVQILNALLELIVFSMASFVCVSTGLYVVTIIMERITITDILVTFSIFIIQNLTRAGMLFLAYHYATRYHLTRTNAGILWACNVRGSYSLMMAFTLLSFSVSASKSKKLFVLAILQILLSFVANSLICTYVIGYLNEETLSKKKWMIERAARLMIAIRKSAVESLRNLPTITDADWNVVIKQTRLKSDFMTAYRYSSWLKKQMEKEADDIVLLDPIVEIHDEAIRQINMSEKACYSRLYAEGMISRESVIRLMYQVTQCIKLKRLMKPNDISGDINSTSFLIRLENQLADTFEKDQSSMYMRTFVFFVAFIDAVVVCNAVMFVLFDITTGKLLYITCHNAVMFAAYCSVVFCNSLKKQSSRTATDIWNSMYQMIVVVTFFDLLVTATPVVMILLNRRYTFKFGILDNTVGHDYDRVFTIIVIMFMLTRLIRCLSVVHIMPIFQIYLLGLVMHMQDKKIFTECDMAMGYTRVITETLRKMNTVITDRALSNEFKYMCRKNKLETAQNLCLQQLQHPNVMAALKVRTAMRLLLNAAEHALTEIKEMGLLEEKDADLLQKEISLKMMAGQNFPYVITPSNIRSVLQNIPWIDGDQDVLLKVEGYGHVVKFYTNDIIVSQGHLPAGIFIILHGVVRAESVRSHYYPYISKDKAPYFSGDKINSSNSVGSSHKLQLHGFYTRGSIIGELAFLIEKPGHKTFRCATYVEAYFLSATDMSEIAERSADRNEPLTRIELKMWRAVAIRQAVRIIHNRTTSSNMSRINVFSRMAESYIVDGNTTLIFTVSPKEVSAVILIYGYVSQFYTELRYVGPCLLPFNQFKFVSHPELGHRVVYLVIKSTLMEENTLDGLVPEEAQMSKYEDSLTISSGSSDVEPHRRDKDYTKELDNESESIPRMLASGMSPYQMRKVEEYRVRERSSFML